jgi:RimJ/RimL family protein N-acetyltransferase
MMIRRVRPDEWESLRDVRLAALADSPDAFAVTLVEERDADDAHWRSWITGEGWDGAVATFVADDAGTLLGMAVGFHPDDEPGVVHLFAMWVTAERRKEGIGRSLVEAVVTWTGEHPGVDRVVLRVTETNADAARFYGSCGFVVTGHDPEPLREGSALWTRRMERLISRV